MILLKDQNFFVAIQTPRISYQSKSILRENIVKKIILALTFLTSSVSVANADDLSQGKISEIRVKNDDVRIFLENATYPDGCSNIEYLSLPGQGGADVETHYYSMFATLLTAYQSGQNIHFKIGSCAYNYAPIIEVWLRG